MAEGRRDQNKKYGDGASLAVTARFSALYCLELFPVLSNQLQHLGTNKSLGADEIHPEAQRELAELNEPIFISKERKQLQVVPEEV